MIKFEEKEIPIMTMLLPAEREEYLTILTDIHRKIAHARASVANAILSLKDLKSKRSELLDAEDKVVQILADGAHMKPTKVKISYEYEVRKVITRRASDKRVISERPMTTDELQMELPVSSADTTTATPPESPAPRTEPPAASAKS